LGDEQKAGGNKRLGTGRLPARRLAGIGGGSPTGDEFSGHCLALTLLGSYLTDAYNGDIRFRKEVSERLAHDVRQGTHARKVMDSYQIWFGEGPELSVLRMLGLFDRPADEKALAVLVKFRRRPSRANRKRSCSKLLIAHAGSGLKRQRNDSLYY
jgi:hypothetical protein